MERETRSALVVPTALLAVGLIGAALILPSGADPGEGSVGYQVRVTYNATVA